MRYFLPGTDYKTPDTLDIFYGSKGMLDEGMTTNADEFAAGRAPVGVLERATMSWTRFPDGERTTIDDWYNPKELGGDLLSLVMSTDSLERSGLEKRRTPCYLTELGNYHTIHAATVEQAQMFLDKHYKDSGFRIDF